MLNSAGKLSPLAIRYADALLDIAGKEKNIDKVENDVHAIEEVIQGSEDLKFLLDAPLFDKKQQKNTLSELAKNLKLQDVTLRFLIVLCENERIGMFNQISAAFRYNLAQRRGQMTAYVQSAANLTKKEQAELKDILQAQTGVEINLDMTTNKDILGGLIVTIGSYQVDASVIGQLSRLKEYMNNAGTVSAPDYKNDNKGPQEEAI